MAENELAVQNTEGMGNFAATIRSLAENPDVPVDKLRQIMEMQEHILDRNARQAFNAAMVRAQKQMPIVPRDAKNEQTRSMYSKYETILKHCKPVYTEEGFSILFHEGEAKRDNEIRVIAEVMHEEGHTMTVWVDIPLDKTGIAGKVNKTDTHAKGSSIQYGRGYLMKQIFNIPTGDDDDGNAAGAAYITEKQENELDSMIKDNNLGDEYKGWFLQHMNAKNISEIMAKDFNRAKVALQARIKKVKDLQKGGK